MARKRRTKRVCLGIAISLGVYLGASAGPVSNSLGIFAEAAETVSADTIAWALKKRKLRGSAEDVAATKRAIEDLKRIRKLRGWNMHDRARLTAATNELARVDLVVYFAFDSAEIAQEAAPNLNALGEALGRDDYRGSTFVVAGHTDAKGSAGYNQDLSERRAEAVKRYIVERFKIEAGNLLTVGYGSERLRKPGEPLADENRRVQVVNLEQ